jgi:hypothetical protein
MTAPYATGTITLANGSNVITGTGTGWQTSLVVGGIVYPEAANGNAMPIVTVDSDTKITAATKWKGASGTYPYAIMRDTAYGQQTVANAQALATQIQRLNNAVLSGLAALTPAANKVVTFGETGEAALSDLSPFGRSLIAALNSAAAYGALGEVPNGTLPTRLRELSPAIADADSVLTNGNYAVTSGTAGIPEAAAGMLSVGMYSTTTGAIQKYIRASNGNVWRRARNANSWGSWKRMDGDLSGPGAAVVANSFVGFSGTSGFLTKALTTLEALASLGPVFGGTIPTPSAAGVGLTDGDFNTLTVGGVYTTTGSYASGPLGNPATHAGYVEIYPRYSTHVTQIWRTTTGVAYKRVGNRASASVDWTWGGWDLTEGNVTGPASSVDNGLVVSSGTSGRVLKAAPNSVVTNALLSNVATATIKGRVATGTGDVQDLTPAQARTVMDVVPSAARQVRLAGLGEIGATVFAWNEVASGCVMTGVFLDGNWGVRNYRYRAIQQTDVSGNWVTVAQA